MQIRTQPEISVIIPAYNGARYICDSIESVLGQTCNRFEVVVVDDGSTDGTREVLEPYIENSSIRYYYQDNAGHGAARNTGIKHARGEYISFHDQDDWLEEDSLERRLNFYKRYPELGLVCSDFRTAYVSDDDDKIEYGPSYVVRYGMIEKVPRSCIEIEDYEAFIFNRNVFPELVLGSFVLIGTVMISKKVLDDIGPFNEEFRWSPDTDLIIRIANNHNIGFLKASTAIYRQHSTNMSQNLDMFYGDQIKYKIKFLDPCWGLTDRDRKRIRTSIGEYSLRKARVHIGTESHFKAVQDIWTAIKYNPFWAEYYKELLLSLTPPGMLSIYRRQKAAITKIVHPGAGAN